MKYPFSVISIECNNNEQLIKVQQELLKNGIEWLSGDRELLYTNLNRTIYSIDLRNKTMVYSSNPQYNLIDIKDHHKSHEDKIYNYYELDKVLSIIKHGLIIPNYKSNKNIRTFESYDNFELIEENWVFASDNDRLNSIIIKHNSEPKFKIGDEVVLKHDALEIHKKDINDYYILYNETIEWISDNVKSESLNKIRRMAYSPVIKLWLLFLNREPNVWVSENSVHLESPNYKPKKKIIRSLNESYLEKPILLMIRFENKQEFEKFKNYCDEIFGDNFIKTNGISYDTFLTGYNYGVLVLNYEHNRDTILHINTLYFTSNRNFFEDGDFHKMYKNECFIYDEIIDSNDKKSFLEFILKNTDIKLKVPIYQSKTNKRLLESNQISIPKIYCQNREESVLIEEILHSFGFTYDSGSKYIIKNGTYNDVTITEIDTINKIFSGVVGKSTPAYVNFSDIKDKFKIMLGVKPSYVPKNKIDRKID